MQNKDKELELDFNKNEEVKDDLIALTPQQLLNHQFDVALSGYDPTEVDSFFDKIIHDYKLFMAQLESKDLEIDRLKSQIEALESVQSTEQHNTLSVKIDKNK